MVPIEQLDVTDASALAGLVARAAAARRAIVVGGPRLGRAARQVAEVEWMFPPAMGRLPAVLRALRPHQWVKNALIFPPLLAAHLVADGSSLLAATVGVAP